MLVGLAQFYSDNLSPRRRRARPSARRKGSTTGSPTLRVEEGRRRRIAGPRPRNVSAVVLLALQLAADGLETVIARWTGMPGRESRGYRTTGNRGRNPSPKTPSAASCTIASISANLPDGEGGWIPAAHRPVLDTGSFRSGRSGSAAQPMSGRSSARDTGAIPLRARLSAGIVVGGSTSQTPRDGSRRISCYPAQQVSANALSARGISRVSTRRRLTELSGDVPPAQTTIERQIAYNASMRRAGGTMRDRQRLEIEARTRSHRRAVGSGDLTREAYLAERDRLKNQLQGLRGATEWETALLAGGGISPRSWQRPGQPRQRSSGTIWRRLDLSAHRGPG